MEEPRPEEHPCPINNKGEDERDYIYELWKWGRIVLAIWLLYIVFLFWADDICAIIQWTPHLPHKDTAGVFGDYFGALNALFAGMAFAGLIVTIRQQSADLKATKEEMRQSREEMEQQTKQFQKDYLSNVIFKRIELLQQLENEVEFSIISKKGNQIVTGSKAFTEIGTRLSNIIDIIFPEEDRAEYTANLQKVTDDILAFSCSLQYLDAWMKSYSSLLEDIETDTRNEPERRKRFFNILLQATHIYNIVILYTFHDTYLNATIIEKLRKDGTLNDAMLYRRTLNPKVRLLFYMMWNELTSFEMNTITQEERSKLESYVIIKYINIWRRENGWQARLLYKFKLSDINLCEDYEINSSEIIKRFKQKNRESE